MSASAASLAGAAGALCPPSAPAPSSTGSDYWDRYLAGVEGARAFLASRGMAPVQERPEPLVKNANGEGRPLYRDVAARWQVPGWGATDTSGLLAIARRHGWESGRG